MITYKTKFVQTFALQDELDKASKKNYVLAAITKDTRVFGTPSSCGSVEGYLCVFAIMPTTDDDDDDGMDFGY